MFGTKVVDFIKQQATALLTPPPSPASASSSEPTDHDAQVLISAMMGALYMGSGADGEVTEEEYVELKKTFREVSEGAVTDEAFDELFDKTADLIDAEGFDVAIADIAAHVTDPDQRYSVLTMAMAACLADGQADESEQELIHQMAEAFGISQEQLEAYYTEVGAEAN